MVPDAGVRPEDPQYAECATMARKSALSDLRDFEGVLEIVRWMIEKDMS
jgi:hypothetical protein